MSVKSQREFIKKTLKYIVNNSLKDLAPKLNNPELKESFGIDSSFKCSYVINIFIKSLEKLLIKEGIEVKGNNKNEAYYEAIMSVIKKIKDESNINYENVCDILTNPKLKIDRNKSDTNIISPSKGNSPKGVCYLANLFIVYLSIINEVLPEKQHIKAYLVGGVFPSNLLGGILKDFDFVIYAPNFGESEVKIKDNINILLYLFTIYFNIALTENSEVFEIKNRSEVKITIIDQYKTNDTNSNTVKKTEGVKKTKSVKKTESVKKIESVKKKTKTVKDNMSIAKEDDDTNKKPFMMNITINKEKFEGVDIVNIRKSNTDGKEVDVNYFNTKETINDLIKEDSIRRESYLNTMYGEMRCIGCSYNTNIYVSDYYKVMNDKKKKLFMKAFSEWCHIPTDGIKTFQDSMDRIFRAIKMLLKKEFCIKYVQELIIDNETILLKLFKEKCKSLDVLFDPKVGLYILFFNNLKKYKSTLCNESSINENHQQIIDSLIDFMFNIHYMFGMVYDDMNDRIKQNNKDDFKENILIILCAIVKDTELDKTKETNLKYIIAIHFAFLINSCRTFEENLELIKEFLIHFNKKDKDELTISKVNIYTNFFEYNKKHNSNSKFMTWLKSKFEENEFLQKIFSNFYDNINSYLKINDIVSEKIKDIIINDIVEEQFKHFNKDTTFNSCINNIDYFKKEIDLFEKTPKCSLYKMLIKEKSLSGIIDLAQLSNEIHIKYNTLLTDKGYNFFIDNSKDNSKDKDNNFLSFIIEDLETKSGFNSQLFPKVIIPLKSECDSNLKRSKTPKTPKIPKTPNSQKANEYSTAGKRKPTKKKPTKKKQKTKRK